MKKEAVAIITHRLSIPEDCVNHDMLYKYEIKQYNEQMCNRCPIVQHRHSDECNSCANFLTTIKMWKSQETPNGTYYMFPNGDIDKVLQDHHVDRVIDRRPLLPMRAKLKFTGKLFDGSLVEGRPTIDQRQLIRDWLVKGSGIICAPPRSGKTVIGCAISCLLGVKTLILTHQDDFLRQFYYTYVGNENIDPFTNISDTDNSIVLIKSIKDLESNPDVALINFQKFIRDDSAKDRILSYLNGKYSLLINDESHHGGAFAYSKLLGSLNMKYKVGFSAQPERRDGRAEISYNFIGPVVAKAESIAMRPKITLYETGITCKYEHNTWFGAMNYLANHKERQDMIVKQVYKDLRAGVHKVIIIPVDYLKQANDLKKKINAHEDAELYNPSCVVAEVFSGKSKKEKILQGVENGSVRVLVAIRSMIKEGINMVAPSMMYMVVPMGATKSREGGKNIGSPLMYQLSFRISTWAKDKPQPVVRYFIDGIPWSFLCWKSIFWKEIVGNLRGDNPRYIMDPPDFERGIMLAKANQYKPLNPPGVYMPSHHILRRVK